MDRNPDQPEKSADKASRVLGAAVREFARKGKAGGRIDAIAQAAGMNKRLLYHYVGDKDTLFRGAIDASLAQLGGESSELALTDREAWQVLVHAAAEGVAIDPGALAGSLQREGESRELRMIRLAVELLAHLFPDLADELVGNRAGPEQRQQRLADLNLQLESAFNTDRAPKPRVKLQPQLRPV